MENLEFMKKGRGKDRKKRKRRKGSGRRTAAIAAASIGGTGAVATGAVLWAKKKRVKAGVPGTGKNNAATTVIGEPLGNAQRRIAGSKWPTDLNKATGGAAGAQDFGISLVNSAKVKTNTQTVVNSTFQGGLGGTVQTKIQKAFGNSGGLSTGTGYQKAPNTMMDIFRGVNKTGNKAAGFVVGQYEKAKARDRRGRANYGALKNRFNYD